MMMRAALLLSLLSAWPLQMERAVADVVETRVNPNNGQIYHLIADPDGFGGFRGKTWPEAEAEAEAMTFGLGAHLATINDAIGNDWFRKTFRLHRSELWIGLNDAAVEGTFEWTSGQPVDFMNWAPNPTSASDPLLGKSALRQGQVAMFENYTSYAKGINGLMVDIRNIADAENLSASDFEFRVGNNNAPRTGT